jgi:hypothetical protein
MRSRALAVVGLIGCLAATIGGAHAAAAAAEPAASPGPAPAGPLPRKDVAPLVTEVFKTGFPFCTAPDYPLTHDEVRWCPLFAKEATRCPALARVCGRGATAKLVGQKDRQRHGATAVTFPAAPAALRILLWALLGVGVGFIIYMIAKQAVAQRRRDPDEPVEVATAAPEDAAAAIARRVETDVQRLLERARAAAARGDFGAALDDAYAALLRKLEGSGVITVEAHRTNGDHVRDLARQAPALRPRMQAVVSNVEQVQFGGEPPTEGRFRSVMLDVVGLLGERLAAFFPFAAAALLAGLIAGCTTSSRDDWDHSPSGRAGVVDLLKRYGFNARERLASLSKIDASASSLLLLPAASVDEAGWQAIANWAGEGGTLIVAGGARKLPDWIGAGIPADDAAKSRPASKAPAAASPEPLTVPADQTDRLPAGLNAVVPGDRRVQIATRVSQPQQQDYSETGDEDEAPALPLLMRGRIPYAVERVFEGGGRAIVLADDHLLTNASLLVGDNARLLIELLLPGGQNLEGGLKLEIAGELTGLVSQDPVTSVKRGRLAPALLQLLLLILITFVHKGAHFGRPVDPIAKSRRAFAEHARAIGLQYARRRAGRHALETYGSYALERLRERLNLSGGKGLLAVAEEVATRTGRPLGDVMRVLVESRPPNRREMDPERDALVQETNAAKDLATLRDIATLLQRGTLGGSHTPRDERRQAKPAVAPRVSTTGEGW